MPSATAGRQAGKSLKQAARKIASKGRQGDNRVVHVNDQEVAILRRLRGGKGSKNPDTGLEEFFASPGSVGAGTDFSGGDFGRQGEERSTEEDFRNIDRADQGSVTGTPADTAVPPQGDESRLTPTQQTIATGLRLATGLLVPGGGLVTGGARALEFFFGPGQDPAFQPVGDSAAGVDAARLGRESEDPGRVSKAGKVQQAAVTSRSVNAASERLTTTTDNNLANPRLSQIAALSRRRAEAAAGRGRGGTVVTSLAGLQDGTGRAKKRLLGS